jgi:hypothetical protein
LDDAAINRFFQARFWLNQKVIYIRTAFILHFSYTPLLKFKFKLKRRKSVHFVNIDTTSPWHERFIYTYVINQQMQTDKICCHILLLTDIFQSLLRPLSRCHTRIQTVYRNCKKCITKPPDVTINILSAPMVIKCHIMCSLKQIKLCCG